MQKSMKSNNWFCAYMGRVGISGHYSCAWNTRHYSKKRQMFQKFDKELSVG